VVDVKLYLGDCLEVLPEIETASVDSVITDPPYPCIKRDYGYWTVEEWWSLIVEGIVPEVRRILKPTGSAVFILQPNSEHVGQMRGWLWEFMAWVCREWNMVQDVWWWNVAALPIGVSQFGLLRPSMKACVWCGISTCYHQQDKILWEESDHSKRLRLTKRLNNTPKTFPSTTGGPNQEKRWREKVTKCGGVTPFNVLPIAGGGPYGHHTNGHGAGTPLKLADWWTRYICPPGGTVCDPFMGSGTMGIAAVNNGCNFVGIEKLDGLGYFPTAQKRIAEAQAKMNQPQQAPLGLEVA